MSAKRERPQPRQHATAVDGSLLGQQVLVQRLAAGRTEERELGPMLALRVEGVNDQGMPTVVTLGVADADLFLAKVQQGVADFKAWRAGNDT